MAETLTEVELRRCRWLRGGVSAADKTTPAALTAPAAGLFLEKVMYGADERPGALRPVVMIE